MEDADVFLHNLAVSLALEAENAFHEQGIDPEGDRIISHLGESFMLSLRHIVRVRKKLRKVQSSNREE